MIINVSTALIKDENLFKEYVGKASELMKEQEVETVCRGKYIESTKGGKQGPHIMAIFKYKDRAAFDYFYRCESYKKLIPLREKSCEMTIHVYDEF